MDRLKTENFDKEDDITIELTKTISLGSMVTNEIKAGAKYKSKSKVEGQLWNIHGTPINYLDRSLMRTENPIDFKRDAICGSNVSRRVISLC